MRRGIARAWLASLLVVGSWTAGPASAGGAASPAAEARALVVRGVAGGEDVADVAGLLGLLQPPVTLSDAPLELDAIAPPGRVTVFGARGADACGGPAVTADAYRGMLEELYQATLELLDTGPLLQQIHAAQTCLAEPVTSAELARADFLEGVMAFSDGDREGAVRSFRASRTVAPDYAWDPEYPPDAQLCFADAALQVNEQPRTTLRLALRDGAEAWLDGRPAQAGIHELPPGRHVVQVRAEAGASLQGHAVDVGADAEVLVVDPAALRDGLRADRAPAVAWTDLLRALDVEGRGVQLVVLATAAPGVWRWDGRGLAPVEISPAARSVYAPATGGPADRGARRAATAVLVAGAGVALAGGVLMAVAMPRGMSLQRQIEAGELPFPHPDDPDPSDEQIENQRQFERWRTASALGTGLVIGGGALALIAIPIELAGQRRRTLGVSVAIAPVPAFADAARPGGAFHVAVHLR